MKKLALNLSDLHVDSFNLNDVRAERGTVNGHMSDGVCSNLQCTGLLKTCNYTCVDSCETHICSC